MSTAGSAVLPESLLSSYSGADLRLREACISLPPHERPAPKIFRGEQHDLDAAIKRSGRFVVAPEQRLVPESEDFARHASQARGIGFPTEAPRSKDMTQDLKDAIRFSVANRRDLTRWRSRQGFILTEVRKELAPLDEWLKANVTALPSASDIRRPLHIGLFAAISDAISWPDHRLAAELCTGMPVVGDIADTEVFRPITPESTAQEFADKFREIMHSNDAWVHELSEKLRRDGRRATSNHHRSQMARLVYDKTMREVQKGLVEGPFTQADLDARFGRGSWRPLARFPVPQKGSVRLVDDGCSSRSNEATRMHETISLITVDFPSEVAALIFKVAEELDADTVELELLLSLDDVDGAYRRVPTSQPGFTTVALWNPDASPSGTLKKRRRRSKQSAEGLELPQGQPSPVFRREGAQLWPCIRSDELLSRAGVVNCIRPTFLRSSPCGIY